MRKQILIFTIAIAAAALANDQPVMVNTKTHRVTSPGTIDVTNSALKNAKDTDLFGTTTARGHNHQFYISARTDGKGGVDGMTGLAGTYNDPFNGATAATLKAALLATALPGNTVHLLAGAYPLPVIGFITHDVTIVGEGKFATILTNQSTDPTDTAHGGATVWNYWSFFDDSGSGPDGDNIVIEGLTIDENTSIITNRNQTIGAISVTGANDHYIKVRALNSWQGLSNECFVLYMGGHSSEANAVNNNTIEFSEVGNGTGAGTFGGTMMLTGGNYPNPVQNNGGLGGMWGNYVHDCPTSIAYGVYANGSIFSHNTAYNVQYGVNTDTWIRNGLTLTYNVLKACKQYGIVIRGVTAGHDQTTADTVENNYITMTGERADSIGIGMSDPYQTKDTVRNNIVRIEGYTVVASASDGVALPHSVIVVADTFSLPSSGTVSIPTTSGLQSVAYTGKGSGVGPCGVSGVCLTGCSGGAGTLHTGQDVNLKPATGQQSFALAGGPGWIVTGNRDQVGFVHSITSNTGAIIKDNANDQGVPWGSTNTTQLPRTPILDTDYTTTLSDYLVAYTSFTGNHTVTLVATPPADFQQIIKDESGSVGVATITVQPSSGTIDGAASKQINTARGVLRVYYSGGAWFTW